MQSYKQTNNISVSTHKGVINDSVLFKDGYSERQMLLDDPVDECLVGVLLLTIVGDCEFHRSAFWDFGHLPCVLVYSIWPEKIFICY